MSASCHFWLVRTRFSVKVGRICSPSFGTSFPFAVVKHIPCFDISLGKMGYSGIVALLSVDNLAPLSTIARIRV